MHSIQEYVKNVSVLFVFPLKVMELSLRGEEGLRDDNYEDLSLFKALYSKNKMQRIR